MPERRAQVAPPRVSLAYVHTNDLAVSFHESLSGLVAFDLAGPQFLMHEAGRLAMRCGTDGLVSARNETVAAFLASDSEWLFWIDTDMGFAPDTLLNLMAVADAVERPIVGALCFASREVQADGMGGFRTYPRPTIFDWTDLGDGFMRFAGRTIYPPASMVRCAATGSACILIHRSVFEKIGTSGWYDRLVGTDGMLLGEDVSLCARAGAAGFPVYVHTGVRTTHKKSRWVAESDFWQQYMPPPAADRVEVVVPLDGPADPVAFMRSLRASTGLARVTVLADADAGDDTTAEAWIAAGADEVHQLRENTVATKVDWAVRHPIADEPWLFVTRPGVRFYPGWFDHAQHMAATFDAAVVGTNDLSTEASLAGESSGSLLINRAYAVAAAARGGARWFDPDRVVDEAKRDSRWVMALGALVERLDLVPASPAGAIAALRRAPVVGTDLAVVVPTRGRPVAAAELVSAFADTCTARTELLFAVDVDDPALGEYETVVAVAQEAGQAVSLCVVGYGDGKGNMVAALNTVTGWLVRDSNPNPPAVIGFLGDDHRPRTEGWDAAYCRALFELRTGIVYGDDLLQGSALPTQVAMTADVVRELGYMAPPTLTHLAVDNWWKTLGAAAGCIRYLPDVVVEHLHPAAGKAEWDEGHKRVNAPEMYQRDLAEFDRLAREELPSAAARVKALRAG